MDRREPYGTAGRHVSFARSGPADPYRIVQGPAGAKAVPPGADARRGGQIARWPHPELISDAAGRDRRRSAAAAVADGAPRSWRPVESRHFWLSRLPSMVGRSRLRGAFGQLSGLN